MRASSEILLVEDDPDLREIAATILEVHGYRVRSAEDGLEALEALRGRASDLIVSDVEMPVLGGPDMADNIVREDHGLERIPVVLVSGLPHVREIALALGTPYFLTKPYMVDELLRLVARALEERCPPKGSGRKT